MSAKKDQYWFKLGKISYKELTFSLINHPKIEHKRNEYGKSGPTKRGFAFFVREEEGLNGVTFQLTSRGKLGIFAPVGLEILDVLAIIQPILEKAAETSITLKQYFPRPTESVYQSRKVVLEKPREKPKASSQEVLDIMENIENAQKNASWENCNYWIAELRHLCIYSRTGHVIQHLNGFDQYIAQSELLQNETARENLAVAMCYTLENENDVEEPEADVVNIVIAKLLKPIKIILLEDRKSGRHYALRFLWQTDTRESVDIVIALIEKRGVEVKGNLEDTIHFTLFGSELGKKQGKYIQNRLVELADSEDEDVRSAVQRLQKRSRRFN